MVWVKLASREAQHWGWLLGVQPRLEWELQLLGVAPGNPRPPMGELLL